MQLVDMTETTATLKHPITKHTHTVTGDPEKIIEWLESDRLKRPFVQDAFPDMAESDRGFLLDGIDPAKWDDMFLSEED